MTQEEFAKKIQKDYEELVDKGNNDAQYFLQHAYRYAHYNEIMDYFVDNMCEDEWGEDGQNWSIKIKKIKEDVNIVEGIYNSWLNYNHPEYYNFFEHDSFIDILEYYFKHIY